MYNFFLRLTFKMEKLKWFEGSCAMTCLNSAATFFCVAFYQSKVYFTVGEMKAPVLLP